MQERPVDWMMIYTENLYVIFLLNSHENSTENALRHPSEINDGQRSDICKLTLRSKITAYL